MQSVRTQEKGLQFLIDLGENAQVSSKTTTLNINDIFSEGFLKDSLDESTQASLKQAYSQNFFEYIKETLNLFSDLAFNRNYLWKKELKVNFPKEYLIPSIFDKDLPNELRSTFCKLAMSLYIDHEPFFPGIVPNMCRVYGKTRFLLEKELNSCTLQYSLTLMSPNAKKHEKSEELLKNRKKLTKVFLDNGKKDPFELYEKMIRELTDYIAGFENNRNIDEFLYHLLEMLFLVIKLDIFAAVNPTMDDFPKIVKNIVLILEHDPSNSRLTQLFCETRRRKEEKLNKLSLDSKYLQSFNKNLMSLMNFRPASSSSPEKKSSKPSKNPHKVSLDDKKLEDNPITKGLYQMLNSFKKIGNDSLVEHPFDTECKLKSLELLSFFNDLRQDSLLTIFVDWFTTFSKRQIAERKPKSVHFEEDLIKVASNCVEDEFKEKIPEIFLTGIGEVDSESAEDQDNLLKNFINFGKNMRKIVKIVNLHADARQTDAVPDLNAIFALASGAKKPNVAILPSLLLLFYRNNNAKVEKTLLKLITRLYNQREELLHNFLSLEMIFEKDEADLYQFLQQKIHHLRILVEKSELWMSRLALNPAKPREEDAKIVHTLTLLLRDLNLFLFKGVEIDNERLVFPKNAGKLGEIPRKLAIMRERQNLMKFSKGHMPLISLVKDCLHQLPAIVFDCSAETRLKRELVEMFSLCFIVLKHFCLENQKNQEILYEYLYLFQEFLQYDLKQIPLICAIFANNKFLLEKVDSALINCFFQLIDTEGRQALFLDFFLLVQRYKSEFLQENQTLVLKALLPQGDLCEKDHKILYSLPSNDNRVQFYFEEAFVSKRLSFLAHLSETDFKDTYRDEPFLYQRKLLEVLLTTTKGANNMSLAVNKLKKTFSVGYLVEILTEPDAFLEKSSENLNKKQGFAALKPMVLQFLEETHFSKRNLAEILEKKPYIRKLLAFEARRLSQVEEEVVNPEYIAYFFGEMLGFLNGLFESFLKSLNLEMQTLDLEGLEDYSSLYELKSQILAKKELFLPMLRQNFPAFKQFRMFLELFNENSALEPANPLLSLKEVSNEQKILDLEEKSAKKLKFVSFLEEEEEKKADFPENPQLFSEVLTEMFMNSSEEFEISTESLQKNSVKATDLLDNSPQKANADESPLVKAVKTKREIEYSEENLWFFFKNALGNCKDFLKELHNEKRVLSEAFLKFELLLEPELQNSKDFEEKALNLEVFLKKIVDFIQFGFKDPENKDTILILLQVLKEMIDLKRDFKEQLLQIQELFKRLDAGKMISAILTTKNVDIDLTIKTLSFASTLLMKGNKSLQNEFLSLFQTQRDSEMVFAKVHAFIRKEIESVENIAKNYENEAGLQSLPSEYYSNKRKKVTANEVFCEVFELSMNKEGILLKKVVGFLTHLVEGHHFELQSYLSKQIHSRNSYDLVTDIVDLLVTYYFNASCNGLFKNINLCVDALIGFVQGPCPENQMLLLDSPLMELIHDVFHFSKGDSLGQDSARSSKTRFSRRSNRFSSASNKENKENEERSPSCVISQEENSLFGGKSPKSPRSSPNLVESESPSPIKRSAKEKTFIFSEETQKKVKPFNGEQIAKLQYKLLVLVQGLLEMRNMRESDIIIKKITQALPRDVLELKLLEIYENFKKAYSKQYILAAFNNFQEKSQSNSNNNALEKMLQGKDYKQTQKLRKKTVLETGFLIFFLICKLVEAEENGTKATIIDYLNKQKTTKEFTILGDNILSKMANFITNLIKSFYSYIKKVKKAVQKQTDKIMNKDENKEESIKKIKKKILKAYKFFHKNSAHIEILRGNRLDKIYFIILPFCHCLQKEAKTEFNENVNRESTKAKVLSLVKASKHILKTCEHEERLRIYFNKNKIFALFANYVSLWRDIAFVFTIILNLFIIASYNTDKGERFENDLRLFQDDEYSEKRTKNIFSILGWAMVSCSLFVIAFFLSKSAPLVIEKAFKPQNTKNEPIVKKKYYKQLFEFVIKCFKCLFYFLQDLEILYYVGYGILAILGTVYNPFFFCFHLSEILLRFPELKTVIMAFWEPRIQLVLVFVLLLIWEYAFALIGFLAFPQEYNGDCDSMLFCFLLCFDNTFKTNGGIGGWLDSLNNDAIIHGKKFSAQRMIYDAAQNIIIVIIMISIIAGIIIDTFKLLREKEGEKKNDILNKCFICGLDKQNFDNKPGGFFKHIKIDHYMWNYVFFYAYLKNKDAKFDNGDESYVRRKWASYDLSWFPLNKAIVIDDEEDLEEKENIQNLKEIQSHLQEAINSLQKS